MFSIDKMSRVPIYEQLISIFETGIISGEFAADEPLPSVRALSQQLSINPNTLQRAYQEIEHRGLCYTVPGSGRYLSTDALDRIRSAAFERMDDLGSMLTELKSKGVSKDEIQRVIDSVYERQV